MNHSSDAFSWRNYARGAMVVACLCLIVGCSGRKDQTAGTDKLPQVILQLNWFPEHEHGGFYAALEHGYYREAGLDVRIVAGGPKVAVAHQLVTGRADFAVAGADEVLLARAQAAMLVALLAPMDQSPRCILVHESSGVESLSDLRGTIALKGGSPFVVFLQQRGYLDNCQVVPFFGGIGRFMVDSDFSQQAYSFSEPLLARRQGSDPRALMLSDEGFNPYAGMVVTMASTIDKKPDLVRKFTQASLRGWRHYLAEPADTNKRLATLNSELDAELLAEGVQALRELCHDPASPEFGRMAEERWQMLESQLVELSLIPADKVEGAEAFTNEFLQQEVPPHLPIQN